MKTKLLFTIALAFIGWSANAQNSWSPKANFGGTARYWATGFSIGNKGYIGTGRDAVPAMKKDFWEWNGSTWTQKADFGGMERWLAVGFSIGTKGYIGTGINISGNTTNDFWEYDPGLNSWTQKANFAGGLRSEAVGFSIGTKGYIGTGYNGGTYYNDFYEYDPTANSWTSRANFGGTARRQAVGFSIGTTKGYIGTGAGQFTVTNDFWEYNPATNSWTSRASFAGAIRYAAVGFSIGNKGYIGTGRNSSYYQDFYEYNPATNAWTIKTNYLNAVESAVGFSTCTKGYIGTGSDGNYYQSFTEYTPSIAPGAAFNASQTTLCVNACINFTDMSTNVPSNWAWTFPGGTPSNSTVQNPTNICYNSAGTYTVTLTASNTNCTSTSSQVITVNPLPPAPVVTPSGTVSICQGQNTTLTISNFCSGCTSSLWTQCPTCALYSSGSSYITNTGGTWYCLQQNSCGMSANSNTVTITINSLPNVTANTSPSTTVCAGDTVTLNGSGASSYVWTGGVTNGIGFVPSVTQTYTVTGTDANGCTSTATVTVNVVATSPPCVTGIQDISINEFVIILPNPSSGKVTLSSEISKGEISVYTIFGEKVFQSEMKNQKSEIDLSKQPDGIYFVHVISEKGRVIKKIIINK